MAKILGFPPPAGASNRLPPKAKRPRAVDWTNLVHLSPWWRLADFLVRECAEGPLKLSESAELPENVVAAAWPLRDPDDPVNRNMTSAPQSESEFAALAAVRILLETEDILESNRRTICLREPARILSEHSWQLWPIIHHNLREEMGRAKANQPGAAVLFKRTLPTSLGFLRTVCWPHAIGADRLLDHLEPSLDFRSGFTSANQEVLPAGTSMTVGSGGRSFLPYEEDWYRLVVEQFAKPLGLVEIITGESGHLGAWTSRSRFAVQKVVATQLLQSL